MPKQMLRSNDTIPSHYTHVAACEQMTVCGCARLHAMADWPDLLRSALGTGTIPIWMKLAYTVFVCVLVPVYWRHYGPANFLWFSDIALFVTLIALWLESSLLASMQAVSVVLLELVWTIDFLARLIFKVEVTAISGYMFKREIPLFVRGLSLFHLWLPPLVLWIVYRLGYDRRAWLAQTLLMSAVLVLCYCCTDRSTNVNWVYGLWGKAQSRFPPTMYLVLLMAAFSLCVYLPSHVLLLAIMPEPW